MCMRGEEEEVPKYYPSVCGLKAWEQALWSCNPWRLREDEWPRVETDMEQPERQAEYQGCGVPQVKQKAYFKIQKMTSEVKCS